MMRILNGSLPLFVVAFAYVIGFAGPGQAGVCLKCQPAPAGMVDWWTGDFNGNDLVGTHNGRLGAGVTITPGLVMDAFTFAGPEGATFGQAGKFGTTDFTIDFWMRTSATVPQALMEKRKACTYGSFWSMRTDTGGVILAEIDGGTARTYVSFDGATNVQDGNFHHIALVRQGLVLSLYVDGKLDGSAASKGTPVDVNNSPPFSAGVDICSGIAAFQGQLDEIQVFDSALSATQISAIYTGEWEETANEMGIRAGEREPSAVRGGMRLHDCL